VIRWPGLVEFADVGCIVWSTERGYAGKDELTGAQLEPHGGVVVAVTERFDTETAEVRRAFLTVDHTRLRPFLRWHTLNEREVNQQAIEWPDTATIVRLWRALAEEIVCSGPNRRRRGPATPAEVRAAKAVQTLQAVVFGDGGQLHAELEPAAASAPVAPRPTYQPAPGSFFTD
jgi:hypothetical protein